MWVYMPDKKGDCFHVGFFQPITTPAVDAADVVTGYRFISIQLYEYESNAAARVNYLNGGFDLDELREIVEAATNRIVSRSTTY